MPDPDPTSPPVTPTTDGPLDTPIGTEFLPESTDEWTQFANFVSNRFYGYPTYKDALRDQKDSIRQFIDDFFQLSGGINRATELFERGGYDALSGSIRNALAKLSLEEAFANETILQYLDIMGHNEEYQLRGYKIMDLVRKFQQAEAADRARQKELDPFDYVRSQLDLMGDGFTPIFDHIDYQSKMAENLWLRPGKFRKDTPPSQIARWQCRIGASTFLVPPTSITISQEFHTGSLTGGAIRQPNSPKTNMGHTDTTIRMSLIFPNHETIWGFAGNRADADIFNWDPDPVARDDIPNIFGQQQVPGTDVPDEAIDFFLSSLRGLVTQFKYSPFLPVKNEYLNRAHGISAVTMNNMSVSTVPGFPFVVAVNIEMKKFNFQPLLPMIQDFEQAIHWGKFRQYMGRAAAALDAKVNESFLVEREPAGPPSVGEFFDGWNESQTVRVPAVPVFDKLRDLHDGTNFNFYYPKTTPSRIFAPDTTDFRQPGEDNIITEDIWDGFLSSLGLDVVDAPQFNFFEYSQASERRTSERGLLLSWLTINSVMWNQMNNIRYAQFIDDQISRGRQDGSVNDSNEAHRRTQLKSAWFYHMFTNLVSSTNEVDKIRRELEDSGNYIIKEWEVPMDKLSVDWSNCIVEGVSVSMTNNFARMQLQLGDEPTYQHIGGGDSSINVSMKVLGEENLIKFRRLFEHINGLARLEQAHGVLGYLGIKNVLTSLCGIKYVLPLNFEVDTVPNMPHVYQVNMSMVDFDIYQQRREELSSEQQRNLIQTFGKRNPFLRMKQLWNSFNGYPDMPLSVKDERGTILGYLDPDWYFRSFTKRDSDLTNWQIDQKTVHLVREFRDIKRRIDQWDPSTSSGGTLVSMEIELANVERQLISIYEHGGQLVPGYAIENGSVKLISDFGDPASFGEPEMRQYLGVYGENNEHATFMDFFRGGYFMLGTEDTRTNDIHYIIGMSAFKEDLASANTRDLPALPQMTKLSDYQNEYLDGAVTPNRQYESMMQDFDYRNLKGRMLKAFPTYMLWLIDEGGKFAGIKLFDNFYGLNSVIDFSVIQSEDSIDDTLVLRVSNMYQKLTTPYRESLIPEDDPLFETPIGKWITTIENRQRNLEQGLTNEILELNNIRLKPGVRVHLRLGYGSNPNSLQTVFNGVITEVKQGDIMEIVAQSDAVELTAMVNSTDTKGSSGKLDGGINTGFWLSEPRDLIVRLLSMGSSYFKEWISWGTRGVIFSDSKFGIRHFGSILYEPMTDQEVRGQNSLYGSVLNASTDPQETNAPTATSQLTTLMGDAATELSELDKFTALPSMFDANLLRIAKLMWVNSFTNRDYELFKRNVYPGNGTGLGQFMGGDMIDAGIVFAEASSFTGIPLAEDEHGNPINTDQARASSQQAIEDALAEQERLRRIEENTTAIDRLWRDYREQSGLTDEELIDALADPNLSAIDLTQFEPEKKEGLFDVLIGNDLGDIFQLATGTTYLDFLGKGLDILDPIFEWTGEKIDQLPGATGGGGLLLGNVADVLGFLAGFGKPLSMFQKMASSPIGRTMGLWSVSNDDDIRGYDEVSFRAQTYMKTVWDLFKICAALLPNYIIAVRPFEDRSTVFYGKPHWLYTSGVIPVSSGVPKSVSALPHFEPPNKQLEELLRQAGLDNDKADILRVVEDSQALKEIMNFSATQNMDPYLASDDPIANNQAAETVAAWRKKIVESVESTESREAIANAIDSTEFSHLYNEEIEAVLGDLYSAANVFDGAAIAMLTEEQLKERIRINIAEEVERREDFIPENGSDMIDVWKFADRNNSDEASEQLEAFLEGNPAVDDFAAKDPVTFAWQFGWKFSSVPIWIDPRTGFGRDIVGTLARSVYDEDYKAQIDATESGRSFSEATDIWRDIRTDDFRTQQELTDIYNRYFPNDTDKFEESLDLFMRFLWQDPFNRAWVVMVVDRIGDGLGDTLNPFGDNSRKWSWTMVNRAFEQFITNPVTLDDANVPHSGAARQYMERNNREGKSSSNFFSGAIEDVSDWVSENIGQVLGLIGDTLTGFIASIRLSLAQMGNALSQAGEMQRQANILNSALDNSLYYKMGNPDDLIRLVDNPFTREYGEPVIEIREPFQRLHFVNSFDSILSNGITENLNDVPTVVTAVSDGKYPVRVHFDKGIPPERQVEKIVETGLYWDNAVGSGLFGFLQPLLHPLETARSYAKMAQGSSDQISSRRVALAHLKEGLKDIYTGELLIVGNSDIRPYDLVYIADVYERMYGMFEVEKVIHHFTPEVGFVTAIVPNAIVTVNDPARWTMLSYMWSKMSSYNLRDDVRASMNVSVDRNLASATRQIDEEDIYKNFGVQLNGAIQYTQGNSGIIKDISAMYTGRGIDDLWNQVAKMDIILGATKGAMTIGGAAVGGVVGNAPGVVIGGAAGYVIGDLLWEGWQWVKDNLLDQHGCYIQFLSKDGQPMDASLSYYSGVAVGSNHTIASFPNAMGLTPTELTVKQNGHYRITTNDLLGALGWSEVETTSLFRETSLYVNQVNSQILDLANRGPQFVDDKNLAVMTARILLPTGEQLENGDLANGIIDGDTIQVEILDGAGIASGRRTIRLASVNTWELHYKNNPYTAYNETLNNDPNDLALLAYQYLVQRFTNPNERYVAIRVDRENPIDNPQYNRIVGVVFHNTPTGSSPSERLDILKAMASRTPLVPWDAFLEDGRPYTLNWEMVMTGYGNVDMRESLFDTAWRDQSVFRGTGG